MKSLSNALVLVLCNAVRVWEKIMAKLQEAGRSTTGMKKRVSSWAKGVGLRGHMNLEKG